MKILSLAVVAALACTTMGHATTVTVNETNAPGGDYADMLGAAGNQLGNAPLGTTMNEIFGDLRCPTGVVVPCVGGLSDPADAFYFDVLPTQQVTQIDVVTEGDPLMLFAQLFDTSDNSIIFSHTFNSNGTFNLLSLLDAPIGPGNYNFIIGFSNPTTDTGDIFYTLNSTLIETPTAPIPLPAGAVLLLSAVGGLAIARRRKAQA